MKKKKAGRPSAYKPEYCEAIIDYFEIDPYIEVEIEITDKKGNTFTKTERKANDLRFLSGFARSIGVCHDTLNEWAKHHKEFSAALKAAKKMQENMVVTNALQKLYDSTFSIFTLKNIAGWKDKQDIDLNAKTTTKVVMVDAGKDPYKAGVKINSQGPD